MRKKIFWAVVVLVIVFVAVPVVSHYAGQSISDEDFSKLVGIPVLLVFGLWGIGSVIASYSKREGKNL